jgi:transcriptional regulator with XRE-family HTH domain
MMRQQFAIPRGNPGLGATVRKHRQRAHLTQAELADRSGVSRAWVSGIETGKVEPSFGCMRDVAAALKIPLGQLAVEAERLEPNSPNRTVTPG